MTERAEQQQLLRMSGISKGFPGVQALQSVHLEVQPGECLGLMGENGAGKSTLMKVLTGVYTADEGSIAIDGQPVTPSNPHQAQQLGVSIIYQEFNLFPNMTVEENIFVGREPGSNGFVRWSSLREAAAQLLAQLGVDLEPSAIVRYLSVAEQQMVEIAKALSYNARIVVMDEPTSALTQTEVTALFTIIQELKERGLGVIFISHRIEEVMRIADRIVVLRDGQNAGELSRAEATPEKIVRMMVGRPLAELFHKDASAEAGEPVLQVRGLNRTGSKRDATAIVLHDVNLTVRAGEIVGLAGLVGSGRTELVRAIFGADPFLSGEVLIDGAPASIRSPQDAIGLGIGLVPEDRKQQALVLQLTVRENISLAKLSDLSTAGFIRRPEERSLSELFIKMLQIRTPSMEQRVINLSGGNQQKVVLAKWLALSPKVLLVDEPTRGVDVGAKAEVHQLLNKLARQGVAILMISSELPEIIGMSDRVLVMRQGTIVGELSRSELSQERIMGLATGVAMGQVA